MCLTTRMQSLSPSSTLVILGKMGKLRYQGIDVINFAEVEPDFHTPDNIKLAAVGVKNLWGLY